MLFVFIVSLLSACEGYNLLVSTPNAVRSESFIMFQIAYELANRDHQVTYISGYKCPKQHKQLTEIWIPEIETMVDNFDFNTLSDSTYFFYKLVDEYYTAAYTIIWSDPRVLDVWKKRSEFDMLITLSKYNEGSFAFLLGNKMPLVQVSSPGHEGISLAQEGNTVTPAILSSLLTSYNDHMNFWERSHNLLSTFELYYYEHRTILKYTEPISRLFPDIGDIRSYYDRVALTLINGNFALDGPVPLLPSQIEIGTINAKKPKPLEKNLKDFVDSSGDAGVIYFSLGSIAKSADIPQHAKEVFVEAFKRMPQKVLWKYEGTDLKLPPNVLTQSWMPQQDILGHPKTKVFISHCGNLGTQEAKYHGVPVLALPIAFDQPRNAARMERKQFAVVLQWEDLTVDKVINALNTLINDQGYQDRLRTVSRILQDQKESPLEKAIWWLEYVARHKGAPHLQYAGKRLSLFQYIMLDVILFWSALLLVVVFVVVYFIKLVCCRRGKGGKNVRGKGDKKKKQ